MPADVHERAQHALPVADDDDRDVAGLAGEERARAGDLVGAARVLPRAPEDPFPLEPQDGGSEYQSNGSVRPSVASPWRGI